MANPNEMSKTEMRLEINAAEAVVNNGGTLSQEQWDRVFKMLQLVKEDYTMKKKELRGHLGMLAFSMDSQWCVMHREDLPGVRRGSVPRDDLHPHRSGRRLGTGCQGQAPGVSDGRIQP